MSLLDMFRRTKVENATFKDSGFFSDMFAAKTGSGVSVTTNNALQIAAVYACVRVIAESIAGLPVKVYRNTDEGREELSQHPLAMIFNTAPNSRQTSFELLEFIVASLCLHGNAFAQKVLDRGGRVIGLEPLLPQAMSIEVDANGELLFHYSAEGAQRIFRSDEIWRVAGLSSNGLTGLSPIGLARESLGLALSAESSAAHLYSNGNQLSGVLQFPSKLDPETVSRLRQQWQDNYGGAKNAHKPLILESGMSYSAISMSASDAQFLESRKFQINEICRWFRVPPPKIGDLDRATFSNIEHQSISFVTDTVLPWCRRLEQSIARDLMTDAERRQLQVRFNLNGLLRGDTSTRFEAYGKAINDGWLSRNEVRKLENYNAVEGLDEYLVPLNMSGADQEPAQSAQPVPDTEQESAQERIANFIATRELNAIANSFSEKDGDKWATDFYTRQAQTLKDLTGLSNEAVAAWAAGRIETLQNEGVNGLKATAIASIKEALL